MKNFLLLFIVILITQTSFSQINDCSECDTTRYVEQDIEHLSLLELKIMRNEIFARHQYVFNDDRISDYFLENYTWYQPDFSAKNNIELNAIEKQNVSLFLKLENQKEAIKNTTIAQLKAMKEALINNDTLVVNALFQKEFEGTSKLYINETKTELKDILSVIDLEDVNWYNENGLYKVTTDNGLFENETSLSIKSDTVILRYTVKGHSELFNEHTAFSYGSAFNSENEYMAWYTFKIINQKLVFISYQAAG
ncbi:YARHG domain-containing protein [Winogradskyella eckloniae]|uniref:YARHG domain-containing protein n=1 Tax=Winogradskyella eckloniae TaxID=1089306 RepID=UPI0015679730|nr:YARHG domain-containing protein [Winogradskyella eckloniae]NRD20053.1 YARHG domain-containing protein [Winogradskyella eckloniae]